MSRSLEMDWEIQHVMKVTGKSREEIIEEALQAIEKKQAKLRAELYRLEEQVLFWKKLS